MNGDNRSIASTFKCLKEVESLGIVVDVKSAKELCPVEFDGKRRSQKQQHLTLYPGNKCMGCYSCYARNTNGGLGTKPIGPEKPIIPGRELINTSIDAFLSEDVAQVLEGIKNPANLLTKNPDVALRSLRKYPHVWSELDYHIQVTTIKDGEIMSQPALPELVKEAKSLSCRVDPIIPGICKDAEIIKHLEHLKRIGVKHITSKPLNIYAWHNYPESVMKYYSDKEYLTRRKTTLMINEDEELAIFKMLRKTTDKLGMTLGICMSRSSSQEYATAPCEGGVYIGQYGKHTSKNK
jgi:hypothetical protein